MSRNMAASSKQSKCSACNKNVSKNSKALLCFGKCYSWFHINCINVSNEEYELFKALNGKAVYVCDKCRSHGSTTVTVSSRVDEDTKSDDGLTSSEYFKLLTDQIYVLSENYKNLSDQLLKIQDENLNLKSAQDSQAEVMRDLLLNRPVLNSGSYADALKVKAVNSSNRESEKPIQTSPRQKSNKSDRHRPRLVNDKPTGNVTDLTPDKSSKIVKSTPLVKLTPVINRPKNGKKFVNKPMIGTSKLEGSNCGIGVVTKLSWIFASRFETRTEKMAVEEYVSNICGGEKIVCEEIQTRYPSYKSFKVGFPQQFTSLVLDSEKWPEGILINKYIPSKRTGPMNGNNSNDINRLSPGLVDQDVRHNLARKN